MSREAVLKKIDVEQDRFKVLSDYILSVGGLIIDLIFILYTIKTYLKVNFLLAEMEENDV